MRFIGGKIAGRENCDTCLHYQERLIKVDDVRPWCLAHRDWLRYRPMSCIDWSVDEPAPKQEENEDESD